MGFALRGALAVVEALAYATRAAGNPWISTDTVYRTIQLELTQTNTDLLAAKEVLQELVDRDSLTGLANRRALPNILRESFTTGASILFFDLNDFKIVNDSYGHQAGDECLKRFARALQATFRPDDHFIRYAGDEFVIVAPNLAPDQIRPRIDQLRDRLKLDRGNGPPIAFSVGVAELPIQGDGEAALRAADEAMYRDKATKSRKSRVG